MNITVEQWKKLKSDKRKYKRKYKRKCVENDKLIMENKIYAESGKGKQYVIQGNLYENQIYEIVKNTRINNIKFCNNPQLGKSSVKNDITCHYNSDFGIEIKKYHAPDWVQCIIDYDKKWISSNKSTLPAEARKIFKKLLNDINLYEGDIPPFMHKNITHIEWLDIKNKTSKWNDYYINIPNNTIRDLYCSKDCKYIQISKYGLYHLGNDICHFNVPEFIVDQQIRIRTKIHKKVTTSGYCTLSVTASCKPINLYLLKKSDYSLDDINKLPPNLIYYNDV